MKYILSVGYCVLVLCNTAVAQSPCNINVTPPPAGYNAFYKKYISVNGIPVISSGKVSDSAFCIAADIVYKMTQKLTTAQRDAMIANGAQLAIMSENEVTTDIPEHSDLYTVFPSSDWNKYRGIGGVIGRATTSCAEENLLCYSTDIYIGENILVHEFAHAVHVLGLETTDAGFKTKLEGIYNSAVSKGLWYKTYAGSNYTEYFAEGVQDWFNTNIEAIPTNTVHNQINTRAELQAYDADLYNLISLYFMNDTWVPTCDVSTVKHTSVQYLPVSKVSVYPNPFSNRIILNNAKPRATLELSNAIGQLIWAGSDIATRDFSSLQYGVYFLKVSSEDGLQVFRLMKE
ncbi:MAG: hypothetical protein JWQ38_713 [Flavipsychrobacter sp.]|nr:hypothetical protein [Flavipsychrobacter sp.]